MAEGPQRRANDARAPQIEAALIQLARVNGGSAASQRELWRSLAHIAASTLEVHRVGAWVLVDEDRALRCIHLLQSPDQQVFEGAVLRALDFPAYFQALKERRTIVADDALNSPLTHELRASYLEPLGITSMLDAPLYLDGRVVGVVCHEHIGPPRRWTDPDIAFASAVADNIARVYVEHQRSHAELALAAYQAQLMELHRMEAIGRMAAGVAHDFRGVIGAAMGFTELMRRLPDLPPQAHQYAIRIMEALERGKRMSEQIVRYGKDDPTSPRVLDVAATIESASAIWRVLLGSNIRLRVIAAPGVSRVFMDPSQLERALLNLVLNARDAMPSGGELTVEVADAAIEDEDGEHPTYVAISVTDTGCGMDEETRAKALNPFFTTKGEQGTGLGLVIVDQIVTRAGGRLAIESEPQRGATVRMYLPRIASATGTGAGR